MRFKTRTKCIFFACSAFHACRIWWNVNPVARSFRHGVILTAPKNLAVVFASFLREDADDEKTGQSDEPP